MIYYVNVYSIFISGMNYRIVVARCDEDISWTKTVQKRYNILKESR
jgi:hypothetical protein